MNRALLQIVSLSAATPALAAPTVQFLASQEDLLAQPQREAQLLAKLDAHLLPLSVRGYERLVAQVLQACGYEEVRVLRDHQKERCSHKGRTGHGGADLSACLKSEFGATQVLVQAKQYERPVSRRFVDELRGALIRSRARQGVLITTSSFPPAAREAAQEDHLVPIHLVDGAQLKALLIQHSLGVKRNRRGRLVVRRRFFRRLDILPSASAETIS